MKKLAAYTFWLLVLNIACSSTDDSPSVENEPDPTSTIHEFTVGDKKYELIKMNKSWLDAAALAVNRGGYLAEIDNSSEQSSIFSELKNRADIKLNLTQAGDGGDASYVWLGGNDFSTEGEWVWDGRNNNQGPRFWDGDQNGASVDGMFNNWGDEPDNFESQNGLAMALIDWPRGTSGQWNDVKENNLLYFVVEY